MSGFDHWFTSVTPLRLACRTWILWQCRPVPSLSGLLPTLRNASSVRLPSASPGCCNSPERRVSHPPPVTWRLMAHQLDDEEHVELGEEQGVDGEEVRGEDAVSLRGEELSPRGPVSRWRRSKTMLAEDAPDRARRDANAEGSKLALDADTTPAPVLATEPDDHFDELVDKRCRPGPRRLRHRLHLRFESSRCQRSRLCGVTMNEDQRSR